MKANELSRIMRRAWAIRRATGDGFAACLAMAWKLWRLVKRMHAGAVRFIYRKTDGTRRNALGTLKDTAAQIKGAAYSDDLRTLRYYDVETGGWRSFRSENLIEIA